MDGERKGGERAEVAADRLFQKDSAALTIGYEPRILRLQCDDALESYLAGEGNRALALAESMGEEYQRRFGVPLDISSESIALEILGHVFVDRMAEWGEALAERAPQLLAGLEEAMERVQRHTAVIDIGEEEVDGNRWFWDALRPFRGLIFALCGQQ